MNGIITLVVMGAGITVAVGLSWVSMQLVLNFIPEKQAK